REPFENLWGELAEHGDVFPLNGVDFVELGDKGRGRIGDEEILQIVMDVGRLVAGFLARHVMAVDDEGKVAALMPGVERNAGNAGFLDRLAQGREMKLRDGLVMAAGLEPATDGDVIDEKRLAVIGREDDCTGGEVPGIGG